MVTHAKVVTNPDNPGFPVSSGEWNADHVGAITVYNVRDYGATGNGTTDDTTAIQAAITATPTGGQCHFPAGFYKFSTLSITKAIHLTGVGFSCEILNAFGHANWVFPFTGQGVGGSILISTATSGVAITFDSINRRFDVSNLVLIGPGSGTSTGIRVGTATDYSFTNHWSNVRVANFSTCVDMKFGLDGTYDTLRIRACHTGLSLDNNSNQNVFINIEVQDSDTDGIVLAVCAGNRFVGGLLQNISGTAGIRASSASSELATFDGFYFEACTATYMVDFATGSHHALRDAHFSANGGNIRMASNNTEIAHIRHFNAAATITNTGILNRIQELDGPTVIDNGAGTRTRRDTIPYAYLVQATPGLRGYWRLGEPSGTIARDMVGLNDGTYVANPTKGVTGALVGDSDTAVTFNGTTQCVTIPDANALDLGDIFSLEAWVTPGTAGVDRQIVSKGSNSYSLRLGTATNSLQLVKEAVSLIVTSTIVVGAGWHHVVATKFGATVKLYIDGVDVTGTVTNATMADTATLLGIGASVSGTADFFNGSIDEVAIYCRALSAGEVADHAAAGR
jgi:hypothetical protein